MERIEGRKAALHDSRRYIAIGELQTSRRLARRQDRDYGKLRCLPTIQKARYETRRK